MIGYVFEFEGKQFDPSGQVETVDMSAHNRAIADQQVEAMKRGDPQVLYLFDNDQQVGTWDGSHKWRVTSSRKSRHNFGGKRLDLWFQVGSDQWHGVHIGDNCIVRARKNK